MNTSSLDVAELATQTMILPLYGSSPASVTAEQAAANQSIYGLDTPAEIIAELRPGGVLLLERIPFHPKFGELALGSLGDSQRLADFTTGLQDVAHSQGLPGLLVIADQEGGRVNRLPVPALPAAATIGATGRADLARRAGELTADVARRHGVNVVFGPVSDIGFGDGATESPLGDRLFGSDPQQVAEMVVATIEGIESAGVGATAKHWPGHGRATADSHVELPSLPFDLIEWQSHEARPFQAAVDTGVSAVLAAHLSVPALDPSGAPASMSAPIINHLRSSLGFDGLVISDALWMPGIRDASRTDAETGLAALAAGVDCLLAPPDPISTRDLVASHGDLRPRLEGAVQRSIDLRVRLADALPPPTSGPDGAERTAALTAEILGAGSA